MCSAAVFSIVIYVYCVLIVKSSQAALISVPQNTAELIGSTVTLNCTSNIIASSTFWLSNDTCIRGTDYGACVPKYILFNDDIRGQAAGPQFSITTVTNSGYVSHNLNINPTQLTDAGVYVCAEIIGGVTQFASAQLIVLNSNSTSNTNLTTGDVDEFDSIYFECSVSYNGSWPPVMKWQTTTEQNLTCQMLSLSTRITSQLTISANFGLNGVTISCVTYFTQPSTPLTTTATNVPSYSYTWSSPTLTVHRLYAPTSLILYPVKTVYQPGELITCSAHGYPPPTYQWTRLMGGSVTNGSMLTVTDNMIGLNLTYVCTATNRINGTTHSISSNISFYVERAITAVSAQLSSTDSISKSTTALSSTTSKGRAETISNSSSTLVASGYKKATIALTIIAGLLIAVISVLVVFILRRNSGNASTKTDSDFPQSANDIASYNNDARSDYQQNDLTTHGHQTVYDSLQPTTTSFPG